MHTSENSYFVVARQRIEERKTGQKQPQNKPQKVGSVSVVGCWLRLVVVPRRRGNRLLLSLEKKMSDGVETATADMMCCASCGKAEVDNIKLKICTACKLVKYCSAGCQKNHRPLHRMACRQWAAEIRDDKLFQLPDGSHLGECPICCLPLPLDKNKSSISSCCCKMICNGCDYANQRREAEEGLEHKCAYCREPMPKTQEEIDPNQMKRVKANDPVALNCFGDKYDDEGDYEKAFEYYTKAAELGNLDAHFNLSKMYEEGKGVEKYKKKGSLPLGRGCYWRSCHSKI